MTGPPRSGSPRSGLVRAAALHHPAHPRAHRYPAEAVEALRCPHCASHILPHDGLFDCPNGHVFDIARQGYVALLGAGARTDTGDSADMVVARAEFLAAGHYRPIASAVGAAMAGCRGPFLEIGAGTGYYLAAVLDAAALDSAGSAVAGIALDSSKYAARRAATDDRVVSVVADAWSALPVQDDSIAAVLSVFAPRSPAEIIRVLAPGGLLVAVTPQPGHLAQLRDRVTMLAVDEGKAQKLAESFTGSLGRIAADNIEFDLTLDHAAVSALVRMGPTARHLSTAELAAQIEGLPPELTVTAAVTVSVLTLVSEPGGTAVRHPG